MSNQQSQGTEPGPAAPPQPAAHTATASAGAAATPPFWPGAQQYGPPQYGPLQFGPPQYGPPQAQGNGHHQSGAWFVPTPPTARSQPQKRAFLPRKAKKLGKEMNMPGLVVPLNYHHPPSVNILPQRSVNDVCIPLNVEDRCWKCNYWAGRFILKPCFHFGMCIYCLEEVFKFNPRPRCLFCNTLIEEVQAGYKCRLGA